MAQAPPERASDGNNARSASSGPRRGEPHPLTDGHLLALLGAADPALRDAISVLALSGMRLAELRRLRVGQCGREAFRVALVHKSADDRGAAAIATCEAMRRDTGMPSRAIRLSTEQATRASVFWLDRVRARRLRPMMAL